MNKNFLFYGMVLLLNVSCASVDDRFDDKMALIETSGRAVHDGILIADPVPSTYQPIRQSQNASSANIYIEGDGYAYVSRSAPSKNPTPKTPVALKMAIKDTMGASVFYLPRPCQYVEQDVFNAKCTAKHWTTHRFSAEIIKTFNNALDDIKHKNNIQVFHLIGFSGGANIAGLLASQRDDIASIRTVAGNVDNDFFTTFHKVSAMPYSLNMANNADALSDIPQVHFISKHDDFVPVDIFQSYYKKLRHRQCVQYFMTDNTTHLDGWDDQWTAMLSIQPTCMSRSGM